MTFDLTEEQRQAVLLAVARLSVERPGWEAFLRQVAADLGGEAMYEQFQTLKREELSMPKKVHARDDDSAWAGNANMAFISGQIAMSLVLAGEHDRPGWTVEWPEGYAPVIDLVRPDGRRFRLRMEEVPAAPETKEPRP